MGRVSRDTGRDWSHGRLSKSGRFVGAVMHVSAAVMVGNGTATRAYSCLPYKHPFPLTTTFTSPQQPWSAVK